MYLGLIQLKVPTQKYAFFLVNLTTFFIHKTINTAKFIRGSFKIVYLIFTIFLTV